jgi:hypothetical protein
MFLHVLVDRTDVWREAVDIAIRPTALPDLIRPDVSARVNRTRAAPIVCGRFPSAAILRIGQLFTQQFQ